MPTPSVLSCLCKAKKKTKNDVVTMQCTSLHEQLSVQLTEHASFFSRILSGVNHVSTELSSEVIEKDLMLQQRHKQSHHLETLGAVCSTVRNVT